MKASLTCFISYTIYHFKHICHIMAHEYRLNTFSVLIIVERDF